MNEKNFKDDLRNENVANDRLKVVPSLGEDKKRLEVPKIEKIIADETDGNFEKFSTDEDVYNALLNLSVQDLRLVFKSCADSLKIQCEADALNKLVKSRIVALFFSVFAVYPESNPVENNSSENNSAQATPNDLQGDSKIISEYLNDVFPNFKGATEIDFAKIVNFLPENSRAVTSIEELKNSLSETVIPEGKIVREFVENVINISGVSCEVNELTSLRREHYLPLFFHAVQIVNFPQKNSVTETPPSDTTNLDSEIINMSFRHFQSIFDAAKKVSAADFDFDIAGELKIFDGNPVTVKDGFYLNVPSDKEILRGLVAIATQEGKIIAIGHIENGVVNERGAEKIFPHMVFDWNMIHADEIQNKKRFLALLIPRTEKAFFSQPMSQSLAETYTGEIFTLKFNITYSKLNVTNRPLCIDFGTSNTTAGTYDLNKNTEPELVTFRDVNDSEITLRETLPTIVYVDSCRDGIVKLKHGYEAKREIISAGYNTEATVFYEIKRWLNSLDVVEEVTDAEGNFAKITRREILKDYLLYVIRTAEQQYQVKFENLHMTSPVKLRKKFLAEMQNIFSPTYKVDEKSLDEGIAIIYHYIAGQIDTARNANGKVLILDCGGGTTDLASCNFSITHEEDWAVLKINADFENGDSNFGGNNITYRILQMLKIKIAALILHNENLTMHELITEDDEEILTQIDENFANKNTIYANFEKKYSDAENLIPTKFSTYTFGTRKQKVKRNFYYLWQLAESIKIEFFKSNLVNVDFEKDKKIYVKSPEEYYLSVWDGDKLVSRPNPMDGVEITIREIVRIILPDLYALLKTLLENYSDEDLAKYKFRLSGQSCKINQFHALFKEFVPGKLMRSTIGSGKANSLNNADSIGLKKYCIFGSIEYVRDARALGKYKPLIDYKPNRRIYDVKISVGNDTRTLLGRTGELNIKKFPKSTSETKFIVCGSNNHVEREFIYHFDKTDAHKSYTSVDEVIELFASESTHSKKEIADSIGEVLNDITLQEYNGKVQSVFCIAALESDSGYGFNICQIYIMADGAGKKFFIPTTRPFESYEDENLQTFFNGDK